VKTVKKLLVALAILASSTSLFAAEGDIDFIGLVYTQHFTPPPSWLKNGYNDWTLGGGLSYEPINDVIFRVSANENSLRNTTYSGQVAYRFLTIDRVSFELAEQANTGYGSSGNSTNYATKLTGCYNTKMFDDRRTAFCLSTPLAQSVQTGSGPFTEVNFQFRIGIN